MSSRCRKTNDIIIMIAINKLSSEISAENSLPKYLTTKEAAVYLRKSVSWIIRRKDIPYLPGNPNVYSRTDLDEWYENIKYKPMV